MKISPGELDYYHIANLLFLHSSDYEIDDKIELFYQQSPLKGTTFYRKLITACGQNHGAKLLTTRWNAIRKCCEKRISEIESEKGFFPKLLKHNLISGSGGVILGALITWLATPRQENQKIEVSLTPKTQVVHDTIFLNVSPQSQETTLVRIVRLPKK